MDEKEIAALSDADLVKMSIKDPEVFGYLMERYKGPLFHYIRRIGQFSKEDTEDILQEVFIKIYRKLNEYENVLKFSSWAYRIAHNHVVDHFRKISARPRTDALEDFEWEKIVSASVRTDKQIMDKDCVKKIKECMQKLPLKYREVMILRFVEEMEYEEIMDILKKPKGSVATLIARGKEILKKNMHEKGNNCF